MHLIEQAAVEPRNVVIAVQASFAHDGKQVGQPLAQFGCGQVFVVDQPFKHAAWQQAHVFGKKAEQALRQKVRHLISMLGSAGAALAQSIGQCGETFGCGFGDVAAGLFGAKALGVGPQPAQKSLLFGLRQFGEQHGVDLTGVAVELGVNADGKPVAHHKQGWVTQRQAVGQKLFERDVEVAARSLVFPGKVVALENVGIAA